MKDLNSFLVENQNVSTEQSVYRMIHNTLHSLEEKVVIHGRDYPVRIAGNGCRYITYHNITFMEQNKSKNSQYAEMARAGKHITWGIPQQEPGKWLFIDDDINKT